MRTFLRGRPGNFTSIQKGGHGNDPARCVGEDEYGNKYFEEFDTNYYINRRWVEFSEAHRFMSHQGCKIPPPWNGWLSYTYDEVPNKKNFVEPAWRPPRSWQLRMDHPTVSGFHTAPGSFGNQFKEENTEFYKQKTYTEWTPKNNVTNSEEINVFKYDRVVPYDITKEK